MISEIAKVISVVQSAIQRALRFSASPSPRIIMMSSAPTSGRKIVTERIGQLISTCPSTEHEPGDERRYADQHGEGVVVEIAGLQPHHAACHVEHPGGDAVRPEAVDQPAVAVLPQYATEPQRRAHDEEIVELVEVPLVEQELVERLLLAGELDRQLRPPDVELPGDDEEIGRAHV